VILDDPYVAPHHAVVERRPAGELELVDAGSRNGLYRVGASRRLGRERIDPDARYRAGRTEFRIRSSRHTVAPELVERAGGGWEPAVAALAVLAAAAAVLLYAWSDSHQRIEPAKLAMAPVLVVLALFVWAGAWGLAGRLLVGERRFAAHLTGAALLVVGFFVAGNWDYLAFALSAPGLRHVAIPAFGAFLAWSLWRHLSLVTRSPGPGVALAAGAVAAVFLGSIALYLDADSADDSNRMAYLKAIKTPAVRLVKGREPAEFFRDAERLRPELDLLRTR
jgi:hypothetical protein